MSTCENSRPGRPAPDQVTSLAIASTVISAIWAFYDNHDVTLVRRYTQPVLALERRDARDSDLADYREQASHGGMPQERNAQQHRAARAAARRRRRFMVETACRGSQSEAGGSETSWSEGGLAQGVPPEDF